MAKGAQFVGRVLNPLDPLLIPSGKSAQMELASGVATAAKNAGSYIADRSAHPERLADDIRTQFHKGRVALDSTATPMASDLRGEIGRSFRIGANQGEVAFNVGSLAVGGPMAKAVGRAADFHALSSPAKFIARGNSPAVSEKLAELYSGLGHHYVGRSVGKRLGLPPWFMESEFNVLKPHMSRGDFYQRHYEVDPHVGGFRLPKGLDKKGWSGRQQGHQRHGPLGRLWYGAPGPLKVATALPFGLAGVLDGDVYEEDAR